MMTVDMIIQIINGVGFPIGACIAMAIFIVGDRKQRADEKKEESEKQEKIYDALKSAIDNNTETIRKLIERLDGVLDV